MLALHVAQHRNKQFRQVSQFAVHAWHTQHEQLTTHDTSMLRMTWSAQLLQSHD